MMVARPDANNPALLPGTALRGADAPVPFGIYVHFPFCAAKCPYCDFNAHVRTAIDEEAWVSGVVCELEWLAQFLGPQGRAVESVFFGGGTPSLMSGAAAGRVLQNIASLWPMANDVEITLEANPASTDAARFADYRAAGINRVSLGVQALNDADLKALGRLHDRREALAALMLAQKIFPRVSLDLIYARPQQTDTAWRAELKEALSFGTGHLSLYQLTIEKQTPYDLLQQKGALEIPGEDRAVELYETTQALLEGAGLPAYEVSNHARKGAESRHNLLYWRYGDYAGVGPGAHGRLQIGGRRLATAAIRLPERWREAVTQAGHGFSELAEIDDADAAREHLLMNLRLAEGIDLAAYEDRWGVRPGPEKISPLAEQGLLTLTGEILAATPRGRLLLNAVIAALLA
jgi:oxygen-independent coproporphyrinogen-3 oxidase